MPRRSRAIAAVRSPRSYSSPLSRAATSAASCSASRLTGPIASRSRERRSSRAARSPVSPGFPASAAPPSRHQHGQGFRGPIEPLGDLGAQPRQPLGRGLAARLEAGALLARLGDCCVGPACRLASLAQAGFARCERILGGALPGGRRGSAAGERLGFAGDRGRAAGQFGDLRGERALPLGKNCALRGAAVAPLAPRCFLGANRGEALTPRFGVAGQPVQRGPRFAVAASCRQSLRARRFERGARQPRIRQQRERAFGVGGVLSEFGKLASKRLDRLGHGGKAGLRGEPVPDQLGLGGARPREALLGRSERGDGVALGCLRRVALGPGGGGLFAGTAGLGRRHRDLIGKLGEAVALAQLFGGRRRTRCRPGETVPAP